eukprot:g8080.t1
MASVIPPQRPPRGPANELHMAAGLGSVQDVVNLVSNGTIHIDQGDPAGYTPLMRASFMGHLHVARILLSRGGSPSVACDDGCTALHYSTQEGHLAITKMLVDAGADLQAKTCALGHTPLHLAAKGSPCIVASQDRYSEVMSVLITAGANLNSRGVDGSTPLYLAAEKGNVECVKVLLRAKANPLLTMSDSNPKWRRTCVPLDIAAMRGHSEVVGELVQPCGIERCGGASKGVQALEMAAMNRQPDIMALLTDAGVVDNGIALLSAIMWRSERSAVFLLQHRERKSTGDQAAYVNFRDELGLTPLLCALGVGNSHPSPRIVRLLINAGADTASVVVKVKTGAGAADDTPLDLANRMLRDKQIGQDGKDLSEKQLAKLECIRRLLLRVEAVHAGSWLWAVDAPSSLRTAEEGTTRTVAASTPLTSMLPLLRWRARRPRVLLAALCRISSKP